MTNTLFRKVRIGWMLQAIDSGANAANASKGQTVRAALSTRRQRNNTRRAAQTYTPASVRAVGRGTAVDITSGSCAPIVGRVNASTTPMLERSTTTTNSHSK